MEFLGQIGAFLQQAGPMALQYPDMRGLLGGIMMFVIRTFRSSRPLEKEFEDFQKKLSEQPAMPPPGQEGEGGTPDDGKAAEVQAQADIALAQQEDARSRYETDEKYKFEREKLASAERIKNTELELKKIDLELKRLDITSSAELQSRDQALEQEQAEHQRTMDAVGVDQAERSAESENEHRQADRAVAVQKASQKPSGGGSGD